MGFGKFLKKALTAPLKVTKKVAQVGLKATKKSAQFAHKATTAPAKKLGISPFKDKPKAAPVKKEVSKSTGGLDATDTKPMEKQKVARLSMKKSTKKPPFFTA